MKLDQSTAEATITSYAECCRLGNADGLRKIFHPQAGMYGYLNSQLMTATPEMFFETVANAPCPESSGEPYQANITYSGVVGDSATLVLEEDNYLGLRFSNSFQLLKIDQQWFIVSKLFHSFAID